MPYHLKEICEDMFALQVKYGFLLFLSLARKYILRQLQHDAARIKQADFRFRSARGFIRACFFSDQAVRDLLLCIPDEMGCFTMPKGIADKRYTTELHN